jgi:undecaprenyl-diphosphatase
MTYLQSLVLGLVQGFGEFLPISSSAHLIIAPWALQFPDPGLSYDVALHFGTLLAVVAYFWQDWLRIFKASYSYLTAKDAASRGVYEADFKLLVYVVLATIPAAVIGKFLEKYAEDAFRAPLLIAVNMALLGVVLWFADGKGRDARKGIGEIGLRAAMIVGFSQVLALIPGVSRSGITITAALLLGFRRDAAARFSFLLATPITFGACLLKAKHFPAVASDPQALLGVALSAVVGFLSIKYLLHLVRDFSYRAFCYYRFAFAAAVGALYFVRG